jgi:hypothetical protein
VVGRVDVEVFGRLEQVELLPGGANIPVTEENKHAYVQLVAAQKYPKTKKK